MNAISESQLWKKRLGDWVINPYVGCMHGCLHCYCPAMPGVKFNNGGRSQHEWGQYVLQRKGLIEALERKLKSFTPVKAKRTEWGDGWILMSFLTDCYQPAEAELGVTRQCLKLLLDAGHKVRIQTRSALVERDFDLLAAHRGQLRLGTSLPYLDDALARVLEPRAAGPTRRLKMLEKAAARGIQVYAAIAPVMPWQKVEEFVEMVRNVQRLNPTEIFCEVLNPKGDNLAMMLAALNAPGVREKFSSQATALAQYNDEAWAMKTYEVAFGCAGMKGFIPWPDTGRGWAKHLDAAKVKWLDSFLPSACEPPGRVAETQGGGKSNKHKANNRSK